MRFDFTNEKYFDNHTHLIDTKLYGVTKEQFIKCYHHGPKYLKNENGLGIPSARAYENLENQGVIKMLVHFLSQYYECDENLDAVLVERNRRVTNESELKAYVEDLYKNNNMFSSVLECELPMGHPQTTCIPGKVVRLFRYEDVMFPLIKSESNYEEALSKLLASVRNAYAQGFRGLKGHILRRFNYDIREVSSVQAAESFPLAQEGDYLATRDVYCAMFGELLQLCGELDMSVHIHTGSTGMAGVTDLRILDPTLLAPFLQSGKYEKTNIVLLHCAYPFIKKMGMMAFNYPNIWFDVSWTSPWTGLDLPAVLKEVLAIAPHNHIMFGSGQHDGAEVAWLSACVAKKALASALDDICSSGLMSEKQALETGKMLLWKNASVLYKLGE